jgi:hypothetical protein
MTLETCNEGERMGFKKYAEDPAYPEGTKAFWDSHFPFVLAIGDYDCPAAVRRSGQHRPTEWRSWRYERAPMRRPFCSQILGLLRVDAGTVA